ncbi:MAG: hypothetical protein PF445_00220 [Melioribacteraceae bacterium]|jgi:Tol biopolymer transport system component|nr:hypothetical protein [Melioribacteraceae bacterium]
MKKAFLFILIFAGISFAQSVTVTSVEAITTLEQGEFFYPVTNYDDSKIIFSSDSYKGLWLMNGENGSLEKLNDYYSSGYEPMFTVDNKIVHRKDDFKNNRRFISIYEYDIIEKSEKIVEEELRDIAQIKVVNENEIAYSRNQKLLEIKSNNKLERTTSNSLPIVMIENSDLVLYNNGERIVVNPRGDGNYLWASVSPDGSKLLFTFAGHGSFVTDLNGKMIGEFSSAHYPQWSSNGEWILYMKDYDDSEKVIESDLFVSTIDGKQEFKITETTDIHEMYPVWSNLGNAVYCNSTEGIIYKIELKFN